MRSSPSLSYVAVFINLSNRAKKQVRFYVLLMLIGLMAGAAVASASTASFRALLFSWANGNEPVGLSITLSDDDREASTHFAAPIATIPLETQLNKARCGHTATLLTDGKVLIVGGEDANGFVNEAEIFDPTTDTFSASGNLNAPRANHTATLLSDGRILVAGGRGMPGLLNSTEIFDPATGAFTSGPNLIGARSGHSATSLNDGKIVVIGGDANGSVEIYIPLLNTFATTITNLSSPRTFHSAALLNDGNILIVGGTAPDNTPVLSGEILNVTSSTLSAVANQTEDSHVRASLRLLPDGKVQIIGGSDHEDMEIYDPPTNQFGAHAHVFPPGDIHPELLQQIMNAQTRAAMFHLGASSTLLNRTGQTITELAGSNQALVTGGVDSTGTFLGSTSTLKSSAATVTTDKLDYAPGTLVIVSGTGWQPNEVVTLMFHEDPHVATENPHTFTVQADVNGNFAKKQYAPEDADHGITYILAAYGGSSGRTSQTAFTDAGPGSLGNYATVGLSGMSAPATVSPSNVATNVTFSALSRGAGLSAAATSDAFNSSSWPLTYIAGNTDYYEFTIAPTFGYKFSASELRVGLQRSSSGPDKAELRSSLDSYGSTIGSLLSVGTGLATFTINLSSVSGLQNRTSLVTFRIYGYGASAAGGTLRIQRVTSPGMVGLEVDGTVAPLNSGTLQFSAANYPDAEANSGTHTKTITVRRTGGLDGAVSVHYATSDGTATTADNDYDATFGDLNWAGGDSADKTFTITVHGDATYEANETVNLTLSAPTGGATIGGTNPATLTITNDDSAPSYITADNASATYGQTSVTLSATVSPSPGGGSVEFFIDGSSVGGGSVGSSGVATLNYNPSSLNSGSHTIRADFGGFEAYSASSSNPAANGTLTINKATIDPHITADNKTYDGANAATIATRSLTGVIGGDDVSLTGGSATFDTKDVGTNKTVTGTGLILTGTKTGNYQLSSTSAMTTADITPATLTPAIVANDKVYDGTIRATLSSHTVSPVLGSDNVTLVVGTANFSDKNVGTDKTVTATGLTLSGADSGNYELSSASATDLADITTLHITGSFTAANKVYDSNNSATVLTHALSGTVGGDEVSLAGGTATFGDANAGNDKTVALAGATLAGADAGNYVLESVSTTTADIAKADATIVVTPYHVTYDAQTHTAGGAATGVLNESLAGLDLSNTTHTNAGEYPTDTWTFTDATGNYNDASGTVHDAIDPASSTTTVNCPSSVTYDGTTQTPCTASVTGDGGLNQALTVNYMNNTDAGTANASASYAGDANHESSSDSKNFEVTKATSTTVVTCPTSATYMGAAITPCTVAVTGANLSLTPSANYNNNVNVGTATASYTYAGEANHESSSDLKNFEITKATSTTVVTCPTSATYTGSEIEPCTVAVTGANPSLTFAANYLNNVNVGTATASYTYAGDTNHESSSDSKHFEITKATSTTVVTCPTSATYTGSEMEPCTVAVTGANLSLTFAANYLNNVNVGTATASYTYAGDANHDSGSDSKNFEITKASTATVVTCPASETYTGLAIEPCTASYSGAGGLSESFTPTYSNNLNVGTASASATYAGDANHEGSSDSKNFTIDPASSTTTANCPGNVTYDGAARTPCTASVTGAGGLNEAVTVNYTNNTDAGTANASATYAGDVNHAGSNDSKDFTIDPASSTTTVTFEPGPYVYRGSAFAATAAATGAGGLNQPVTVVYSGDCTNVAVANGCTATANFAGDSNHSGSGDARSITITAATTTTTITNAVTLASSPTVVGQSYTVNWSVSVNGPGAGTPTGTVTVSGGSGCSAPVAVGSCTMTSTTAGAKTLVATYTSNSTNFNGSVSAVANHTVNAALTTTTITSDNPDASVSGGTVAVIYAVAVNAPDSGAAIGTVTVTDSDSAATCNSSVATGQCTLALVNPGTHHLTATYVSSTADFTGSASAVENHTVTPIIIAAQIVFSSNRDGNSEIYKMAADGSGVMRLTNNGAADADPEWSPDKTKIAFTSTRDGNFEIYVMNANGGSATRLTTNSATDFFPAWSPDGSRIAFTSNRNGNFEVYVMNSNGTGAVTRLTTNCVADGAPAWSPDGSKLAFTSKRDGNYEIYVMNSNGSGLTRLTNNGAIDALPSWSPDGLSIAFNSTRDGNLEIYTMAANGSVQMRRTTNSASDGEPSWGANGKIAFSSTRNGNLEIYTMNADGTLVTRLTNNSAWDLSPHW
jgi:hypothetical protein